MVGALEGIRVVDLTAHLAGPYCTMILADMGAEVIKIEPHWGDPSRLQQPLVEGESPYYMFHNRNKLGVTLDLKSPKGVEILKRLAMISDVVVENYRPGVMERLGIGYETLREINPRIIYAAISGFGQYGPYVRRPSFDIVAQAMSGWMYLTSLEPRGMRSQPSRTMVCINSSPGDTVPGMYAAIGILAALHFREKTGKGQKIDVSQMDCLMSIIMRYSWHLNAGQTMEESVRELRKEIHGIYPTKDGFVVIRAIREDLDVLAKIVGVEPASLQPPSTVLEEWTRSRTRDEVTSLLSEKLPCAPVLTEVEVVNDPNTKAREMIAELDHPLGFRYRTIAPPLKFSESPGRVERTPPLLGQHTEEVLTKLLGYSKEDVARLVEEKVVTSPPKLG